MAREIRPNLGQADEQQIQRLERELEGAQPKGTTEASDPYRASGAKHGAAPPP